MGLARRVPSPNCPTRGATPFTTSPPLRRHPPKPRPYQRPLLRLLQKRHTKVQVVGLVLCVPTLGTPSMFKTGQLSQSFHWLGLSIMHSRSTSTWTTTTNNTNTTSGTSNSSSSSATTTGSTAHSTPWLKAGCPGHHHAMELQRAPYGTR